MRGTVGLPAMLAAIVGPVSSTSGIVRLKKAVDALLDGSQVTQ